MRCPHIDLTGRTLWHEACAKGDLEGLHLLAINFRGEINHPNYFDETPIHRLILAYWGVLELNQDRLAIERYRKCLRFMLFLPDLDLDTYELQNFTPRELIHYSKCRWLATFLTHAEDIQQSMLEDELDRTDDKKETDDDAT